LADTLTPVTLYLRLRDYFEQAVLLESNDFGSAESCFSYIAAEPIATFKVQNGVVSKSYPDGEKEETPLSEPTAVPRIFQEFISQFDTGKPEHDINNGFFGHTCFDGVQYFDTLKFDPDKRRFDLPDINYSLYRFILAFNHYKDELYILENIPDGLSQINTVEKLISRPVISDMQFSLKGKESSNITDEEFREYVRKGKHHCKIGDVFQIRHFYTILIAEIIGYSVLLQKHKCLLMMEWLRSIQLQGRINVPAIQPKMRQGQRH